MIYKMARSALFSLNAEAAHELTLHAFRHYPRLSTAPFAQGAIDDPVSLMGLEFRNRVGLAAGLDKNADCLQAWERLGFGFVEVGTVTPRPQPGNPRPRMFRLPQYRALINRLGFNNKGVDYLIERVRNSRYTGVLGINIGKNADTPIQGALEDYLICLRKVHAHAGYVTINISSPNTKNLRDLQNEDQLQSLLSGIAKERELLAQRDGKQVPVLVKIAPDVDDAQIEVIARTVQAQGLSGVIASNTTVARDLIAKHPLANEAGGLSGAPLMDKSTRVLQTLRRSVGSELILVGVGGVCSAEDALRKRQAGADLVQIYSGFIYEGPDLIRNCAAALARAQ